MDIAPTAESVVTAQRARLLNDVGTAAQASQQTNEAKNNVTQLSEGAQNLRSLNTGAGSSVPGLPLDPSRGRNLNVTI